MYSIQGNFLFLTKGDAMEENQVELLEDALLKPVIKVCLFLVSFFLSLSNIGLSRIGHKSDKQNRISFTFRCNCQRTCQRGEQ